MADWCVYYIYIQLTLIRAPEHLLILSSNNEAAVHCLKLCRCRLGVRVNIYIIYKNLKKGLVVGGGLSDFDHGVDVGAGRWS